MMSSPQPGIFALGTSSHAYLELDLRADAPRSSAIARIASLREPRTTIGGVNLVTGFRPELWAAVSPDATPPGVVGFNESIVGRGGYVLPATQHDVVLWLNGSAYDAVFDLSRAIVTELGDVATLANEMVGWPYHHDRDLTGFEDGTENPTLVEAMSVALIPAGEPGEGGSVLLLQQWEHDAVGWERLPVRTQEAIIGRRKGDSAELEPRPSTSHVARTDQDEFGKIFRRNIAYGTLTQHGTIFVGFSRDQAILRAMLESMVGIGDQPADELTTVTRAITGSYYFVPAAERLAAFDEARADA
jgi:putative iron-dependent peroxidase